VLLQTNFFVSVGEVRVELGRVLRGTHLWDGKASALQMTELTGDAVELRALVSAADSGNLWDLQCHVWERLPAWLQPHGREHPQVRRVESVGGNGHHNQPDGLRSQCQSSMVGGRDAGGVPVNWRHRRARARSHHAAKTTSAAASAR
jgi:hypothetical protein